MPLMLRHVDRKGGVSPDWLHRHHIEWDAPVTV
jgi:hypothetical protein